VVDQVNIRDAFPTRVLEPVIQEHHHNCGQKQPDPQCYSPNKSNYHLNVNYYSFTPCKCLPTAHAIFLTSIVSCSLNPKVVGENTINGVKKPGEAIADSSRGTILEDHKLVLNCI